jgi:hypothetical protein
MNIPNSEYPPLEDSDAYDPTVEPMTETGHSQQKLTAKIRGRSGVLLLLAAFALGLGSGYLLRDYFPGKFGDTTVEVSVSSEEVAEESASPEVRASSEVSASPEEISAAAQLNLPDHYPLLVAYEDVGPQLLAAGAIDYDRFIRVYDEAGQPLTQEQQDILTKGSETPIVINQDNAYFLLNFFWALGLANQNAILTEGPMMQYGGQEQIENFASTGGWTLTTKPVTELYASTPVITLAPEQQARFEEVAYAVYRPCCNNPTSFPDCNHGMAMLGVLELMASHNATVDEMFTAAKHINAFWFPQQTLEIALVFQNAKGQDFVQADPREFVGSNFSSASGFQGVHQWLAENNLLDTGTTPQ